MDAERVLVRRLHPLDLLEVDRLDTLLRVLLVAVLDVRRDELASVERRHVLPLDALPDLEGPHAVGRVALPRLGKIALEAQVGGTGRFVGKRVADEPVAREPYELEGRPTASSGDRSS